MAVRPVFMALDRFPYVETWSATFTYAPGFALSQQRKNIQSIHDAFRQAHPDLQVLEISSKGLQPEGNRLSAFVLPKAVPSLGCDVPVERIYQAGKVFEHGGPYLDLLMASSRDAKRDPRPKESGRLVSFVFDGQPFPLEPRTLFYDWLYIQGLLEHPDLASPLLTYDAFTDIAFSPSRSLNCQARAAALFVSLTRLGHETWLHDPMLLAQHAYHGGLYG